MRCCNTEHPLLPFSGKNISIMDFLFFKTHLIIIYIRTTPQDVIHDSVYEEESRNEWISFYDTVGKWLWSRLGFPCLILILYYWTITLKWICLSFNLIEMETFLLQYLFSIIINLARKWTSFEQANDNFKKKCTIFHTCSHIFSG